MHTQVCWFAETEVCLVKSETGPLHGGQRVMEESATLDQQMADLISKGSYLQGLSGGGQKMHRSLTSLPEP